MPKGGQRQIETANVTPSHEQVRCEVETIPGDLVMLSVSDTRRDIAAQHLNQVFEPFSTTKAKGTGRAWA